MASTLGQAKESQDGETTRIHFRLYQNYLVVAQGSLGKLKKRNLLIDTGSNPTILDQKIAQQLDVKPLTGSVNTLGVISGSLSSQFVLLPSLQLGPVHSKDLRVAVADLSLLTSKVGTRIDAVVGFDVLGQSSFRIDYDRKEIVFGDVDFDAAAVPFGGGAAFVTVPMTIDEKPIRMMVDTGTASLILFANRIGEWRRQLPQAGVTLATDLGGNAPLPVVRLTRIRIGRQELGPRNASIASRQDCCDFDGVMGISALRMKQIGFDFERRLFSWQLQDREIPSMSESGPANCMPAWSRGFTSPGQASTAVTSSCGFSFRPGRRMRREE
jgi:predicted aspartyl protease